MAKKHTWEKVKELVESEGFTLLSDTYQNDSTKLDMLCPEGHPINVSFNGWKYRKHNACIVCQRSLAGDRRKLSSDYVKNELAQAGYKLLSQYQNSHTPFEYECPRGHQHTMTWDTWKQGGRCAVCANNTRRGIEYIRKQMQAEGYKLLSTQYKNAHTKLNVLCSRGHPYQVSWNKWQGGRRCPICSRRLTVQKAQAEIDKRGSPFICLEVNYPEKLGETELVIQCTRDPEHVFTVTKRTWWATHRCPECDRFVSVPERKIYAYLRSYGIEAIQQDRKLIYPYEVDLTIPDHRVAIEVNGLYWHSENSGGKTKYYHRDKLLRCQEQGYRLISVFEDELTNKPDIVYARLRHLLGVSFGFRVGARECKIKEVSHKESADFLNRFHLLGQGNSRIRLGAFFKEQLIAVMTFSRSNKAKRQQASPGKWELDRFCVDHNFCVAGIASKLLHYFESNYVWSQVVSFAERRWSEGSLYTILGFNFIAFTEPNYWYMDKYYQTRISRFQLRKTKDDDPELTEWENRQKQDWDRIWDCGQIKFIKYKENLRND